MFRRSESNILLSPVLYRRSISAPVSSGHSLVQPRPMRQAICSPSRRRDPLRPSHNDTSSSIGGEITRSRTIPGRDRCRETGPPTFRTETSGFHDETARDSKDRRATRRPSPGPHGEHNLCCQPCAWLQAIGVDENSARVNRIVADAHRIECATS